jgi:hypothetical protein
MPAGLGQAASQPSGDASRRPRLANKIISPTGRRRRLPSRVRAGRCRLSWTAVPPPLLAARTG